jgi:hypothetical protein
MKILIAGGVKEFEQLGVEARPQIQGSHDAGDAQQVHSHCPLRGGKPHESAQT